MARRGGPTAVQLEGMRELRRAFKNSAADIKELTGVHRVVAKKAKADILASGIPKESGKLRRTYRHMATQSYAGMKVGKRPASEYWGVMEFANKGRYKGLAKKYGNAPRAVGRIGQVGYKPGGRWFYPTLHKHQDEYTLEFFRHLEKVLRKNFGR